MGLLAPVTEFILSEHSHKKIEGNVLFIGRQTTFLDQHSLGLLLKRYQITSQIPGEVEIDTSTMGGRQGRFITDKYFMKALGVQNLRFMDVSDYEGADIVSDLGYPVDSALHEQFDFIYNGGCLDNMFNPVGAMENFSKMLKPGGRVICMESASSYNSPYLIYSPGWFFDYYVTNGFSDCKVYVCSYKSQEELFFGPWDLFYYDWEHNKNGPSPQTMRNNHLLIMTIAEKGPNSTSARQPIQYQYRNDPKLNSEFENNLAAFSHSKRRIINSDRIDAPSSLRTALYRITDRLGVTLYRSQKYLRYLGAFGENALGPGQT